jgi:DNA-directed RNA polymerase subunit alpha
MVVGYREPLAIERSAMLKPTFTITAQDESDDYAKLIIEPLEQGYGHTLGVSLRRALLSSIEGAAITRVSIDGVQHQFSTLEGMAEDITEFILNLKQLNFRLDGQEEEVELTIEGKGPGTVTGSNINLPANAYLANPDQVLAVLSDKKSSLRAKIIVSRGLGYSPASDRPTKTIGEIPVDAAFSPVKKVAYKIEATRVGRRTDFDKLIMQVWTDGTVKPLELLQRAGKILVAHFTQIFDPVVVDTPKEVSLEDRIENEVLKLTVEELDLPTRIANALRKGGYETVKDLTLAAEPEIAKVKNLGGKSVETIADALKQKDLTFAESHED